MLENLGVKVGVGGRAQDGGVGVGGFRLHSLPHDSGIFLSQINSGLLSIKRRTY